MRARNVSHYTIPDSVLVAGKKTTPSPAPTSAATEWFCYDEECEMVGKPFETYRIYLEHFGQSQFHQNDAEAEEILDALGVVDVVASDQVDNSPSELVTSDIFVCREPCCHRYGFNFRCRSEYNRHANVSYHISAAKLNQTLLENMQPGPALAAEQEAIRTLTCNAPGCPSYRGTFSGSKTFLGHITGAEHRQAWTIVSGACFFDEQEETLTLPGIAFDAGGASGRCVNEQCPKYGMSFNAFWKLKQHAHSFAHAMTEDDMDSTDESPEEVWVSCDLEGMEVAKDNTLWRCVKKGCRGFGRTIPQRGYARKHSYSITHITADEETTMSPETPTTPFAHAVAVDGMASTDESPEEVWVTSPLEGMEVTEDNASWRCTKRGCRGFGHVFKQSFNAKKHNNSAMHTKADQDATMSPKTPTTPFATPKSTPETALMTPMDLDTLIPATPLSPSAGRGSNAAMTLATPTKTPTSFRTPPSRAMIKLRRTSNAPFQVKRRQDELERQNRELEDRVKRLEEQLAKVLGKGATQKVADGRVHEQGNTDEGGNKDVDHMYQFVRSAFRPIS
ncbi:hypothetical protein CEP54_000080 [Fusarium duplospermum]|uniref:Uncharacterized protein n=1 Tax=Fusarium duplospermum TaxID=1325734 RepID=A0A428R8J3_9HYPO|nr:hypothetical protein CEP54_000080 [Fusarium duplospermum]